MEHQRKYFSREGHLFNLHKHDTVEVCANHVGPYTHVILSQHHVARYIPIYKANMYSASLKVILISLLELFFWMDCFHIGYKYYHFDYTMMMLLILGLKCN